MWGFVHVGARRTVITRRAVLVVGGLTLLAGIEQEHNRPTASATEVDAATSGRPSPSPNSPQSALPVQTRSAPSKSSQTTSVPTKSASSESVPSKSVSSSSAPGKSAQAHASQSSSSQAHPTRTEAARLKAGKSKPKKASGGAEEPRYYIRDGRKRIALTIDDGPSPIYTPQILKLLEKYGVTATFSMIGVQVRAYPGIAREVADAGHMIANHTWTHLDLPALSATSAADQIKRATSAIHKATGRKPALFRAPYGAWSPEVLELCAKNRLTPVDWSVDPRDWARPGVSSIVDNIMRNTRTGSIILEHDGGGDRSQTVAALGIVLPRLIDAGYRFVTV
jgi:peptidoglycan-N-acetylglucosamine deacetylase